MPKFTPGKSGNPAGRRPGAVGLAGRLRLAMAKEAPDIIASLVSRAKQGDTAAASLILARVLAPLRATDEPAPLPRDLDMGDLASAPRIVLEALGSGRLTPDQAQGIALALASLARVKAACELENRIEALENQRHAPQP